MRVFISWKAKLQKTCEQLVFCCKTSILLVLFQNVIEVSVSLIEPILAL